VCFPENEVAGCSIPVGARSPLPFQLQGPFPHAAFVEAFVAAGSCSRRRIVTAANRRAVRWKNSAVKTAPTSRATAPQEEHGIPPRPVALRVAHPHPLIPQRMLAGSFTSLGVFTHADLMPGVPSRAGALWWWPSIAWIVLRMASDVTPLPCCVSSVRMARQFLCQGDMPLRANNLHGLGSPARSSKNPRRSDGWHSHR